MLDGRYLRENLDAIRAAMGARGAGWDFDRFVALDDERRRLDRRGREQAGAA